MNTHRPFLKQFRDLRREDFEAHPIWIGSHGLDEDQPWYEETDEETFRPREGPLPGDPSEGMLLVRAKLTFADGRAFPGFLTPQHEDSETSLSTIQPHVFLSSGSPTGFWCGVFKPDRKYLEKFYSDAKGSAQGIFPIQFEADPGLANGITAGELAGFYSVGLKTDKVTIYT